MTVATITPTYMSIRLRTFVSVTLPIPPIMATSIKIINEKNVPLSVVKISGRSAAKMEPPALYWRAMIPDCIMHMEMTMIKLVFFPNISLTRALIVL